MDMPTIDREKKRLMRIDLIESALREVLPLVKSFKREYHENDFIMEICNRYGCSVRIAQEYLKIAKARIKEWDLPVPEKKVQPAKTEIEDFNEGLDFIKPNDWKKRLDSCGSYKERRKIVNEFLTKMGMEGYGQADEELDKI